MGVARCGFVARYVAVLLLVCLGFVHWRHSLPTISPASVSTRQLWNGEKPLAKPATFNPGNHSPIRQLMVNASAHFDELISKVTTDMWAASGRYRIRRGRHPPPGFDKWVEAASAWNAIVVEDYYDRIYKDLAPFWALDPKLLRERAKAFPFGVRIRRGEVLTRGPAHFHRDWLDKWATVIKEFSKYLPDLDMPVNLADEARLVVPFDHINKLVKEESEKRGLIPLANVTRLYMSLFTLDYRTIKEFEPNWIPSERSSWDIALAACGPDSAAHSSKGHEDGSQSDVPREWKPGYAFEGFIQNWTAAMDPCEQPHVRHIHPAFTQPRNTPATDELFPLFSASKMSINNDILLPAATYFFDEESEVPHDTLKRPWERKIHKVFWRGKADRLIKMLNGRLVSQLEATEEQSPGFNLPPKNLYASERRSKGELGQWLNEITDVSSDESDAIPLPSKLENRFLPDVDGAYGNQRFRTILRSTSLPFKSTLFHDWHDDRLLPWMHFVPLDSTLQDLHSVLEFFADDSGSGNAAARYMAERGAEWAERVMRKEDMKLYLWRLLLEWGRLADENRDTLGFTEDVQAHEEDEGSGIVSH